MKLKTLSIAAIFYGSAAFALPSDLHDHPDNAPAATRKYAQRSSGSRAVNITYRGEGETWGPSAGSIPKRAVTPKATNLFMIKLPELSQDERARLIDYRTGKPLLSAITGIGRPVEMLAGSAPTPSTLPLIWSYPPDGSRAAGARVESRGAAGLRVGLLVRNLQENAIVKFYGVDFQSRAFSYTGREILDVIDNNIRQDGDQRNARTFWAPAIAGDAVTVEIEIPAGAALTTLPDVSIPLVSHIVYPATRSGPGGELRSDARNLDATCHSQVSIQTYASTRLTLVVENGDTWPCSGTLLNSPTKLPLVATASHCVANQTVASTIESDWFFGSDACNSGVLSPRALTLSKGATHLFKDGSDFTLLKLNEAAPQAAYRAPWYSVTREALPAGSPTVHLHHPMGDFAKVSFGTVTDARPIGGEYAKIGSAFNADGGTIEVGSSGSGLWVRPPGRADGPLHFVGTTALADDIPANKAWSEPLSFGLAGSLRWLLSATSGNNLDFSRDGMSDVVFSRPGQHLLVEARGELAARQTTLPYFRGPLVPRQNGLPFVYPDWTLQAVADFNGDGGQDFIWRQPNGRLVMDLTRPKEDSSGVQLFIRQNLPTLGFTGAAYVPGDLNGDGRADIVWIDTEGTRSAVWLMSGGLFSPTVYRDIPALTSWRPNAGNAAGGSFLGNGQAQLLVQKGDDFSVLDFNGTPLEPRRVGEGKIPSGFRILGVGDFDGDGLADIALAGISAGDEPTPLRWLKNNGFDQLTLFTQKPLIRTFGVASLGAPAYIDANAPAGWRPLKVGDYNGDGFSDLLLYNQETLETRYWLMRDGTQFKEQALVTLPQGAIWSAF